MTTTHEPRTTETTDGPEYQRQVAQVLMMLLGVASREGLPLPDWMMSGPTNEYSRFTRLSLTGVFDRGAVDAVKAWGAALGVPVEREPRYFGDGTTVFIALNILGHSIEIRTYTD